MAASERAALLLIISAVAALVGPGESASSARSLLYNTRYGQPQEGLCRNKNTKLAEFLKAAPQTEVLLPRDGDYVRFQEDIKAQLDAHMLPDRAIHHLFSEISDFYPYCDGDWLEFGVAYAATINLAARFRAKYCGQCPYIHGFDTFTGLPEYWKRDDHSDYKQGAFDLEGNFPGVEPNVHLVKGLFNESLPKFLRKQAAFGAADVPLTFLHVDCDLYRGAADVFKLVAHKIVPGTVIVFDDLVNYQYFRDGEMLAWWEYLQSSGAKFATIGMLGPLKDKNFAVDLNIPDGAYDWFYQSAAFVIVSVPGKTNPFETGTNGRQTAEVGRRRREAAVKKEVLSIDDKFK